MSLSNNYPTIKPSLLLDFANVNQLDPRITFTRTSTATYYNSNGLLTSAALNTPRFDYNPSTLAPQGQLLEEQRTNLLTYSSEFDNAAWNAKVTVTVASGVSSPTGNLNAYTATATGANSVLGQIVTSSIGTYTSSVWIKRRTGTGQIALSAGDNAPINVSVTSAWQHFSVTSTASTTTVRMYIHIAVSGDAIDVYGAQLEASSTPSSYIPSANTFTSRATTGSFVDSTGTLQSAAINVARNTYNPSNLAVAPFLLLEEARTNSIRNSTMVGAIAGSPGAAPTNWLMDTTGGVITRTIVGTGTESGITYIEVRYQFSGAGSASVLPELTTQIAALSGQTWTSSSYVKLISGGYTNLTTNLDLNEYTSGGGFLAYSTLIFTATSSGLATQRALLTRTLTQATTAFVATNFRLAATGAADITLRIGLPQLEQGFGATSVIPTTTAAVTRAADVSSSAQTTRAADFESINTLTPWFNQTEGTFFVESSPAFSGINVVISGSDLTNNNSINIYWASNLIQFQTVNAGVSQANLTGTTSTAFKMAGAYKANDFAASLNGLSATTDNAGSIPAISNLTIGALGSGGSRVNGYIRRIAYYPKRLSNTELQGLTS